MFLSAMEVTLVFSIEKTRVASIAARNIIILQKTKTKKKEIFRIPYLFGYKTGFPFSRMTTNN